MIYDFDKPIDRSQSDSIKWKAYPKDVLPLWIADTDFEVAPEIIAAIQERMNHPVFGYGVDNQELIETVCERMKRQYAWEVKAEEVTLVAGIVSGYNYACRAFVNPGRSVLIQTPAYPPFFTGPTNNRVGSVFNPLIYNLETSRYEIDFNDFEAKIVSGKVGMFILCNPQNPTGRVFNESELRRMAQICLDHDVTIVSDEIHAEIIYSGEKHIPIASLLPEIAAHSVTLIAPSKTFNIPGLSCSVAIIQDEKLRETYRTAMMGFSSGVSLLSQYGGLAAYRQGGEWLRQMNAYLESNRDFVYQTISAELPEVRQTKIQGTFLAWLDFSDTKISADPASFFLEKAKVALNEGKTFGAQYGGFTRLNFGTNRARLSQALERMVGAFRKL